MDEISLDHLHYLNKCSFTLQITFILSVSRIDVCFDNVCLSNFVFMSLFVWYVLCIQNMTVFVYWYDSLISGSPLFLY